MPSLRVCSWNVRSLRDDVDALVEGLYAVGADIVCLQEAPRFFRWRYVLAELARRAGLLYTCGGATTGGPALLTALSVAVQRVHEWRLPKTRGLAQRGAAVAEVVVGGAPLLVASTHLGLDAAERERHAAALARRLDAVRHGSVGERPAGHLSGAAAAGSPVPAVLAGDFNETSAGPAWRLLTARHFRDAAAGMPDPPAPTFPAAGPRQRIDAVFVAGCEVEWAGVPNLDPAMLLRASDHRPVVADLRLPARWK